MTRLLAFLACVAVAACSRDQTVVADVDPVGADAGTEDAAGPPLELTPNLCDDASNMALLGSSLGSGGSPSYGEVNSEQVRRMVEAPTEGPFYMVNLIRFRDRAAYPDGRETDLTGREANALYSPTEFLAAIGARAVFVGDVSGTAWGGEGDWDQVAVVEYPCPLALFAMSAHPGFQARSIHKEAGVEVSTVMVTHVQPLGDLEPTEGPFPPSADDPAFEIVQVIRLRDQAEYGSGTGEPSRTGREALDLYTSRVREAERRLGLYPKARLVVQGVFIGDGRVWDEVWIDFVPSRAAFEALSADPEVLAALRHRDAALDDEYDLVTRPVLSSIPGAPGGAGPVPPPLASDGTGTLCQTDEDCPGDGVNKCLRSGDAGGFCTREGCGARECESPYLCCHDCSDVVSSMLPFEGSACLPDSQVRELTAAPVSCTCN